MTFDEIVATVAKRLNLTSATAIERIGEDVNERYKWLATSIGFNTIARREISVPTIIGDRYLTFGPQPGILGVQKTLSVFIGPPMFNPPLIMGEVTFDQMRNQVQGTDPVQQYAVAEMGAKSVKLFLGSTSGAVYAISADVLASVQTLQSLDEPAFSENFHNCLVYGALATEYGKLEKDSNETKYEKKWEDRVAELRLFIAKSAYLNIYQNRTGLGNLSVPLVSS